MLAKFGEVLKDVDIPHGVIEVCVFRRHGGAAKVDMTLDVFDMPSSFFFSVGHKERWTDRACRVCGSLNVAPVGSGCRAKPDRERGVAWHERISSPAWRDRAGAYRIRSSDVSMTVDDRDVVSSGHRWWNLSHVGRRRAMYHDVFCFFNVLWAALRGDALSKGISDRSWQFRLTETNMH